MKQIEYTEKQLLVLEILEKVEKFFNPTDNAYDFQKEEYRKNIKQIKDFYGIKEKHLTLREYIKKIECGVYHEFKFRIKGHVMCVCNVAEFESVYNAALLDAYYVINDDRKNGYNTGAYSTCIHELQLVPKDD